MQLKLHIKVRQVDVAKALEESSTAFASKIVYHAILRAIGHHAEISVAYDGVRIKLLGKKTAESYYYEEPHVTKHILE